jgi:hypothetical protein
MIAEFMGLKFKNDDDYISELKEMRSDGIYFEQGYMTSELKYHTSWDWLMPVVENIEKTNNNLCEVIIHKTQTEIITGERTGVLRFSYSLSELILLGYKVNEKIGITYHCVCEFIKWYNENK